MRIDSILDFELPLLKELQPADWPDMMPHFQFYTSRNFCFPVKLFDGNKIVGIGTSILHNDVAWLAHIIVHPQHRNKGFGKIVTQELIKDLQKKNIETINLVATDLGAPVYSKLGFETVCDYAVFKDSETDFSSLRIKDVFSYREDFLSQMKTLDAVSSGEDRFFRLEEHLNEAFVFVDAGNVEGFYLPGFGEGLIVAGNAKAGVELMKLRHQKNKVAVVPEENVAAVDFLKKHNFKFVKKMKRMQFGKKRAWKAQNLYNRVGGQIG